MSEIFFGVIGTFFCERKNTSGYDKPDIYWYSIIPVLRSSDHSSDAMTALFKR